MGFVFSKVFDKLFGKKDIRILILGLDNAGKTTILNKLHLNDVVQTIPTIGFNVETVTFKNLKFQVWDLGGQSGIRPYWRSYYPNTNGIIYVVDSVDRDRLDTTKQELLSMLQEEELKAVPLMVLANKQVKQFNIHIKDAYILTNKDQAGAQSEDKISEFMGLSNIQDRQWSIFKCSAFTGHGLNEGMEWLVNILESQK